jgi:hypothetical protein
VDHVDVLESSAEVVLVGQARDRAGSVGGVCARDGDRIEVLVDDVRRRVLVLYLGDDMCAIGMVMIDKCIEEVVWLVEFGDVFLEHFDGNCFARVRDLDGFLCDDVL